MLNVSLESTAGAGFKTEVNNLGKKQETA